MNIKNLAEALDLSISTVSKALRDSHEISIPTKNRVQAKAKEMNYEANPFASGLRKQKSKTIAVVIPEVVNDFFGPAINGIESIATEKGYHVLIYLTHEDVQKEISIINMLQNGRVDGVLMSLSEHTSNTSHLEELRKKEIPIVFFDRIPEHICVPKVITNEYSCSIRATEHLIRNGCKRIAFLSISQNLSICNKRINGYKEALRKNKLPYDNSMIIPCIGDEDWNKHLIRNLLLRQDRPDGIFACVEKLAIATYKICEKLKLNIPKDVKILTFSNSYTASLLNPPLTTITQPAYEMGRESAYILFNLVEKRGNQSMLEKTVLNSKLIERYSTKEVQN